MYGDRLRGVATLAAAQTAISATVLWRLRVLAGWMPAAGGTLARAMAAGFERQNIVAHAEQLRGGEPETAVFDLGTLATAWPQLRTTPRSRNLRACCAPPAGGPRPRRGRGFPRGRAHVLWLRRLAAAAPAARSWAAAACALLAARVTLVDRAEPSERLVALVRPLVGTTWTGTRT
ncbi:MAG: hypothetical protein WDM88_06140 [Galbitalea sp.]